MSDQDPEGANRREDTDGSAQANAGKDAFPENDERAGRDRLEAFNRARRIVQTVVFVFFLVTVVFSMYRVTESGYGFVSPVSMRLWPRLSVFSGMVVSLTGRVFTWGFLPALLVMLAAVFTGRAFCGWICPLGTTLDAVDRYSFPASGAPSEGDRRARRTKYYVLLAGITAALAGSTLFAFLDPLSIVVRLYAALLDAAVWAVSGVLGWVSVLPVVGGAASWVRDGLGLNAAVRAGAGLVLASVVLMVFVPPVVALMAGRGPAGRRFWCRYCCPFGALLGLVGRWALLRRRVSESCIACNRCVGVCPTGCIPEGGKETLAGECVLCGRCQPECPVGAVSFSPGAEGAVEEPEIDVSRRGVVAGLLVGLWGAAAGALTSLGLRKNPERSFLRPPGVAGREDTFLDRCVRCGACTRVCPKGALHLDFHRAGLEGIGAPVLIPRTGYCEYECNLCGRVCPTRAIPPLPLEKKKQTAIGIARFDTTRCLPWVGQSRLVSKGRLARDEDEDTSWVKHFTCLTCEENCPVPGKAIKTKEVPAGKGVVIQVPFVEDTLCIGCGRCEYVCPLEGEAGVRVVRWKHEVEQGGDGGQADKYLPGNGFAPGWEAAETFHYPGDRIFDYINGAAVVHMGYGFKEAFVRKYRAPSGAALKAEAYLCGEPADAFALYTTQRSGKDEERGGAVVSSGGSMMSGVKGRAFFQIEGAEGEERNALIDAVAGRIEGGAVPPAVLGLLPGGFRAGSSVIVRMPEVAENYIWLPFLRDLGLGRDSKGALAAYETAEGRVTVMVVKFDGGAAIPGNYAAGMEQVRFLGGKAYLDSEDPFTVVWTARDLLWTVSAQSKAAAEAVDYGRFAP